MSYMSSIPYVRGSFSDSRMITSAEAQASKDISAWYKTSSKGYFTIDGFHYFHYEGQILHLE